MKELDPDVIRWIALCLGLSSASSKAIAEYDLRTANGEDVSIYEAPHTFVVGPKRKEGQ